MVTNLEVMLRRQFLAQLADRAVVKLNGGVAVGANQMMMPALGGDETLGGVVQVEGAHQVEFNQKIHGAVHSGPAQLGVDFLALAQNLIMAEMLVMGFKYLDYS
jgi:hypothetical protein